MKATLIFVILFVFSCKNATVQNNDYLFVNEELISNNIYLGYNSEGKVMPFKLSVDKSGDTIRTYPFKKYYYISFDGYDNQTCYLPSECIVPFKISIHDLIKNNVTEPI